MTTFPTKPGLYERQLLPQGHRYTLSIPEGYQDGQQLPLVMALHWGGPVAPYTGKYLLLGLILPAWQDLKAIIVAPDRNLPSWDNNQSEVELLTLLDLLQAEYDVDPRFILITGYSLGGIGTWRLAANNQDRFTAALPMAANPPAYVLDTHWHIPVYVIHGQDDELFPVSQTRTIIDQLRSDGVDIEFTLVKGGTHFDTGAYIEPLKKSIPWIRQVWNEL